MSILEARLPARAMQAWSELSPADLERELAAIGEPRFRARQLYDALHRRWVWDWDEVRVWPARLRSAIGASRPLRALDVKLDLHSSRDASNKILFALHDGATVETVLLRTGRRDERTRHTVCVSSQVGCPAACSFCATGLGGFTRNLSVGEITDQVEFFAGRLRAADLRVQNVVYMGMGEPFLNYRRVIDSLARLLDTNGLGLGARHITVSTVGIVPAIRRFAVDGGQVNLAISLHAPNDELRHHLVPYNDRFPIGDILDAVREYVDRTHRRVSFEYVLLKGTNDTPALARELAMLLRPLMPLAHVNLIPWNPFREGQFVRSEGPNAEAFAAVLNRAGVNATIRYSKGLDIDAACGQLRDRDLTSRAAS